MTQIVYNTHICQRTDIIFKYGGPLIVFRSRKQVNKILGTWQHMIKNQESSSFLYESWFSTIFFKSTKIFILKMSFMKYKIFYIKIICKKKIVYRLYFLINFFFSLTQKITAFTLVLLNMKSLIFDFKMFLYSIFKPLLWTIRPCFKKILLFLQMVLKCSAWLYQRIKPIMSYLSISTLKALFI